MGTLTINTTGPEDARIIAAFGAKLGLPGNASAGQVKSDVIGYVRAVVRDHEARVAAAAAVAAVSEIGPS